MRVIRRQCLWSTTLLHVRDKSCIVTNPKAMNHCEVRLHFCAKTKVTWVAMHDVSQRDRVSHDCALIPVIIYSQHVTFLRALPLQLLYLHKIRSLSSFIVTPTTSSTGSGIIRLRLPGIFVSLATCKAVADHRPTSLAPNRFPRRRSYSCGVVESVDCIRYLGTL
jgi:hypothetical protein